MIKIAHGLFATFSTILAMRWKTQFTILFMLFFQIFKIVASWLRYDWANRKHNAYDLITKIDLDMVSPYALKSFMDEVTDLPQDCKKMLNSRVANIPAMGIYEGPFVLPPYIGKLHTVCITCLILS